MLCMIPIDKIVERWKTKDLGLKDFFLVFSQFCKLTTMSHNSNKCTKDELPKQMIFIIIKRRVSSTNIAKFLSF